MQRAATLLIDVPLDERSFRGVLLALSRSALAGAILQDRLSALHSFGDAERDLAAREVKVVCRPANTAARAALIELRKHGFEPVTALEFHCAQEDRETMEDLWALLGLYAEELRGWVMTWWIDYDEAARRSGGSEGLLHAPLGHGKRKGVLLSASTLRLLTP